MCGVLVRRWPRPGRSRRPGAVLALAYRVSLQVINDISPQGQRAEVVASFQIVHFIANSLPVIGVGLLALAMSTPMAYRIFALVLIALASVACLLGLRCIRRDENDRGTASLPSQ